jgi:hypothetical protein
MYYVKLLLSVYVENKNNSLNKELIAQWVACGYRMLQRDSFVTSEQPAIECGCL